MPITREELQRGRTLDSLTDRLFNFLQQNRGSAFSAEEIAIGVGYIPRDAAQNLGQVIARGLAIGGIRSTLDQWAQQGLIESSGVQDERGVTQTFYAAK